MPPPTCTHGPVVGRVGASAVHGLALAALAEGRARGSLRAGEQDLVARELHHAVGLGAVGAGLGEEVDGRLEDAVGEVVVGVDDGLLVPLDPVARDHLGELGDVALHVVVRLGVSGPVSARSNTSIRSIMSVSWVGGAGESS